MVSGRLGGTTNAFVWGILRDACAVEQHVGQMVIGSPAGCLLDLFFPHNLNFIVIKQEPVALVLDPSNIVAPVSIAAFVGDNTTQLVPSCPVAWSRQVLIVSKPGSLLLFSLLLINLHAVPLLGVALPLHCGIPPARKDVAALLQPLLRLLGAHGVAVQDHGELHRADDLGLLLHISLVEEAHKVHTEVVRQAFQLGILQIHGFSFQGGTCLGNLL
mmetsp:Transcript_16242/g.28808  ORF Transcript_16242/g.28808 Transcript_16242/m.28808 type:complete len:216 (+) Transcript_16242:710-1357(+)